MRSDEQPPSGSNSSTTTPEAAREQAPVEPAPPRGSTVGRWLRGLWGSPHTAPTIPEHAEPVAAGSTVGDSFVLGVDTRAQGSLTTDSDAAAATIADFDPARTMVLPAGSPLAASVPLSEPSIIVDDPDDARTVVLSEDPSLVARALALGPPGDGDALDDSDGARTMVFPAGSRFVADARDRTNGASDATLDLAAQRAVPERQNPVDPGEGEERIRIAELQAQLAAAISARERHAARAIEREREVEAARLENERRVRELEEQRAALAKERDRLVASHAVLEGERSRGSGQRDQQLARSAALEHLLAEAQAEHAKANGALAKLERQAQTAAREHERLMQAMSDERAADRERLATLERDYRAAQVTSRNAGSALRDAEERAAGATREVLMALTDERDRRLGDLQSRLETATEDRERARASLLEVEAQATRDMQETLGVLDGLRQSLEETAAQQNQAEQRALELELALERTREELSNERKQSQKQIAELSDRTQALLRERQSLTQALTERSSVAEELSVKLRGQSETLAQQQAAVARFTKVAQERDGDLARLKGELELRLAELGDVRGVARRTEGEFRELKSRFQSVTAEKDAKEKEYVTLRSRLETEVAELRSAIEDRDRRTAVLQESVDKAELRALELEDKHKAGAKQLETLRTRAQEELGHRSQEIRKLKEDLATKATELQKFTTTLQERDRLRSEEVGRVEARLREKDAQVNELLQLMETKAEAMRKVESQRATLADENTTLTQKLEAALERAKQFAQKFQERSVRASELETELRDARLAKTAAEDRLRALQAERDARQSRQNELETAAREAKAAQQTLELRVRSLSERLERREAQVTALESGTLKLRAADGSRGGQDATLRDLEETLAVAEKERGELKLKLHEQERELEARSSRLAELELSMLDGSSPDFALADPTSSSLTQQRELERLRAELQQRDGRILELQSANPQAAADLGDFAAIERSPPMDADEPRAEVQRSRSWPRGLGIGLSLAAVALLGFVVFARLNRASDESTVVGRPTRSSQSAAWKPATPEATGRARTLVATWAGHIERRRVRPLLELYVPGYHGQEAVDRAAFEAAWGELLANGDWLAVDLDALTVSSSASGDALLAAFPMEIRTAGHLEMGMREIEIVSGANGPHIRADRWAAARP